MKSVRSQKGDDAIRRYPNAATLGATDASRITAT
jgi:hypothetical protein